MSGSLSAFPYVGGKFYYADWIIGHFPDHRLYVEPFGGAASVLLNKPPSHREVYNDIYDSLVLAFRVIRTLPNELQEHLNAIPYSRRLHEQWGEEYYGAEGWPPEWPDDDIERVARWLFLRFSQFGAKMQGPSGFKSPTTHNSARTFRNGIDRLEAIAERIDEVTLECRHFAEVIDRYDREGALFYCDPPYVDRGQYYNATGFDHDELANALEDAEGYWLVSYYDVPERIEMLAVTVSELPATRSLEVAEGEKRKEVTERLAMNFDPDEVEPFRGPQTGLAGFGFGEEVRPESGGGA